MKKFILGIQDISTSEIIEYVNKEIADFESEEWCEVYAETLEEAKAKYFDAFEEWNKSKN